MTTYPITPLPTWVEIGKLPEFAGVKTQFDAGNESRLLFSRQPVGAELNIEYALKSILKFTPIVDFYLFVYGDKTIFDIDYSMFGAMGISTQWQDTLVKLNPGNQWVFAEPPETETHRKDMFSINIKLTATI